jgi:hypothetical protein
MPALTNSQAIRTKIRLAHGRLDAVADRFWSHPEVAALYPEFLFLVHSMIRTSVRMMEEAAAAAYDLGDGDPVAPQLAAYFEKHCQEEAGHDDWLLDDLEVLGVSRETVWARMPSTIVAGLIGAQYYWIRHVHPVALLGYLAVLEGNPPKVAELEAIRQRTGLPAESFRTLVKHAEIDPHHRDDLNALIDTLPLAPRHHSLISVSAFHTIEQVSLAFEEVLAAQRD